MKKHKGDIVGNIGILLLGILAAFIIVSVYFSFLQVDSFKDKVDGYARSYLLEMETVGYLTPSGVASLRQELTDLGCTDIDFSGTAMSPVGYGMSFYLNVNCRIPYKSLNMAGGNFLDYFFEDASLPIVISRKSTAKY